MNHTEAKQALYDVLNHQQTVTTRKLNKLIFALSEKQKQDDFHRKREIDSLKEKNKELKSKLKTKNRKVERMKRDDRKESSNGNR